MKQVFCLLFMSIMFPLLGSCSDDDDDDKVPEEFTGNWKLVIVEYPMVGKFYDFSMESVIIEIKSSGILKVTEHTATEAKPFYFKPNNNYSMVRNHSMEYPNSWKVFTICDAINCFDWYLYVENDTLLIDLSPIDGPKNYFVKN